MYNLRDISGLYDTVAYEENGISVVHIPLVDILKTIGLRLHGTVNVTPDSEAWVTEAPLPLISRIEFMLNGGETIKNLTFNHIVQETGLMLGFTPQYNVEAIANGAAFDAFGMLFFQMPGFRFPIDTLLQATDFESITLVVHWANYAAIAAGTGSVATGVLDVVLNTCTRPKGAYPISREGHIIQQVTAANTNLVVKPPLGNKYRRFWIRTISDSEPVNTVINTVSVRIDNSQIPIRGLGFDYLQDWGSEYFEVALPTGYICLEFSPDGLLTTALDSAKMDSLELVFDVAHPGTTDLIHIFPQEVMPCSPTKVNAKGDIVEVETPVSRLRKRVVVRSASASSVI